MKLRWHLFAVVIVAFAIGLLFLQEPGFGDDLTYWSFAFDLHERGLVAWQKGSFHDLRWPVWGVSWLIQAIAGPGLLSYYGVPLLHLAAGAVLAFVFTGRLGGTAGVAWAAAIAFSFHPLLDTICYRPMPDLSEGVIGGAIMLCWWELMRAQTRGRSILFAALTGAGVFMIEANRVTGVFIVLVMLVCTLAFYRRRFGWLVAAGGFAALLYAGQAAFYHWMFDDWLHDITANSRNKGAKGTDLPNPWSLPFRFLDTLWKGSPLAPAYCVTALVGIFHAWRRCGVIGRVLVIWLVGLYLAYACAPQSLWPVRPLVRDADRFLAALALPMSVLAAVGLWQLSAWLWTRFGTARLADWRMRFEHQRGGALLFGAAVVALLGVMSSRTFFNPGFVPEMRRYLSAVPDGTKVFSHKHMREIVFLVDAHEARRLTWFAPNHMLLADPEVEAMAAQCSEFWYARKLVWLTTRKGMERKERAKETVSQPELGSYFRAPEQDWRLAEVFVKENNPDLVFYRRRTPGDPPVQVVDPVAGNFAALLPPFPITWTGDEAVPAVNAVWKIPPELRGKLVRIEIVAASSQVEPFTARLSFSSAGLWKSRVGYLLKPYLYSGGGRDFFAFRIPPEAIECHVELKLGKSTKRVELTSLRVLVEPES